MSKWERFKEFIRTPKGKKTLVIVIVAIIIIVLAAIAIYNRYFKRNLTETDSSNQYNIEIQKGKVEEKEVSCLDGVEYNKDKANRHPMAIMVENHTEARPQIGLDKASIIYEAIAEGGITRFMPIYGSQDANKVGPVRSARTYYLDWVLEYDAFYAHVGGNIDALNLIPKIGIKDLDQFKYGTEAYWRENEAKATEHTMYSDTEKLRDIAKANDWNVSSSDFTCLKFKTDLSKENRSASQSITINFSSANYNVEWVYDPENNMYKRLMGGLEHKDRVSDEQLTAKNIIIQKVKRAPTVTAINEQGWNMDTVGEGEAFIVMDGKKIDATWKKSSREDRTRFYDPQNNEIEFNPGVFWYEIVPPDTAITIE